MSDVVAREHDLLRLSGTAVVPMSVALSVAAGTIHAWVVPEHLHEYWLFGTFFIAVAIGQFVWAASVTAWPGRATYLLGALGSPLLIGVWAISRTVGLPFGPEPWEPEPAAGLDIACVLFEAGIVVAAGLAFHASHACIRSEPEDGPGVVSQP